MALDDKRSQKEIERQRILEEIRRRAEEAELERLEQEDAKLLSFQPPKRAEPPPTPPKLASPPRPNTRKINDLRERIIIAIDRGKADKAAALLDEFRELVPDDLMIEEYEDKIAGIQKQARVQRRTEVPVDEDAGRSKADKEEREKKVAELIASADFHYQQEKYAKALEVLDEALTIDPKHGEATKFRETVRKAHQLAERIKQEEALRREREAVDHPVRKDEPAIYRPLSETEVWGSATPKKDESSDLEVPDEEPQPIRKQREAVIDRAAGAISKVRIPLRKLVTIAAIVLGGIAGYIVVDKIRTAVFPPSHSLLLLPPLLDAVDSSDVFYSQVFTEDLINDLSRVTDLRVIAATTTFELRSSGTTPAQLAKSFGANYYLMWSFTRAPEAVVVSVSLYDTVRARPMYVNRYQSSVREIVSVRRDIARSLVDTIHVDVGPEVMADFVRPASYSVQAYSSYARGRYYLANPAHYPLSYASDAFGAALRADSTFKEARAAIGWTDVLMYEDWIDTTQVRLARASSSASRAFSSGFTGSEVYRVWGVVDYYRGQYSKALQRLERAVDIAPSDAEAQRRLAIVQATMGQFDEAIRSIAQAIACDPRNVRSYTLAGMIYQLSGDYKSALQSYEQGRRLVADQSYYSSENYSDVLVYLQRHDIAIQIHTDRVARERESFVDYYKLGRVYQIGGRSRQLWESALARSRDLITLSLRESPDDPILLTYLALAESRLGRFKDAQQAIDRAYKIAPNRPDVLYAIAKVYALQQGKQQEAYAFIERAVAKRYILDELLDMDFYRIMYDDEFRQLIARP